MKKFFSICLVAVIALADNVIDLTKSQTPDVTISTTSGEVGIGYVRANFKASQAFRGNEYLNFSTIGIGNGVDMFWRYNRYFIERFGMNFGIGTEIMRVKWTEPLLDYTYNYLSYKIDDIPSETAISLYFNIGLFIDIWKNKTMAMRIFGNAGYGAHWFLGGQYYTDTLDLDYDSTDSEPTLIKAGQGSGFFELGMRYIFAKKHGIDLVYKFNSDDMFKSQSEYLLIKTSIKRTNSFVLRYVYEY